MKHIQSASRGELAISTIAIYELEFATLKSRISDRRRRDNVAEFTRLRGLRVLDWKSA